MGLGAVAWPLSARPTLRAMDCEADQAALVLVDPDVVVVPVMAVLVNNVHGNHS